MEIRARNVNEAYQEGLMRLYATGVRENSRNGEVLVLPNPMLTTYLKPAERVLFDEKRDANPYFHLMEALWMVAGRDDLEWLTRFNPRMTQFSDNGDGLKGAYGFRWQNYFELDQLYWVVSLLKMDPESRRAVIAMWDPNEDLCTSSKDVPCNTHIYFDLRGDRLNMTVCCRSNDAVWGAYGANVVHFSVLQEFMAAWLKKPVGVYRQFSNNFHLYTKTHSHLLPPDQTTDPYIMGKVKPYPTVNGDAMSWRNDLNMFLSDPLGDHVYEDKFFECVAAPMYSSWHDRRNKKNSGMLALQGMELDNDWRLACERWILRREWRDTK